MSIWEEFSVLDAVVEALQSVHLNGSEKHALGRPFLSAYQLAIRVDEEYPEIAKALKVTVGGEGTGKHQSLAQYLGRQLSRHVRSGTTVSGGFVIEGGFLSHEHMTALAFATPDGTPVKSSLVGGSADMSVFRLADAAG